MMKGFLQSVQDITIHSRTKEGILARIMEDILFAAKQGEESTTDKWEEITTDVLWVYGELMKEGFKVIITDNSGRIAARKKVNVRMELVGGYKLPEGKKLFFYTVIWKV